MDLQIEFRPNCVGLFAGVSLQKCPQLAKMQSVNFDPGLKVGAQPTFECVPDTVDIPTYQVQSGAAGAGSCYRANGATLARKGKYNTVWIQSETVPIS